jgi:hypothetical protein
MRGHDDQVETVSGNLSNLYRRISRNQDPGMIRNRKFSR